MFRSIILCLILVTSSITLATAATQTVTVNSNFYSPSSLTINVGDNVQWNWVSGFHTVTSGSNTTPDGKFCSLNNGTASVASCTGTAYGMSPPYTYTYTFNQTGNYPYYCTVHGASMTGTITVNQGGSNGTKPNSAIPTSTNYSVFMLISLITSIFALL
jgi:plastocyanin